ncbi:MAG TPA: hypothetical protein VFX59_11615 [Polyangiales bacterium]|nr:hypothetical protein [Polyangiales bacterium]
MADLEEHAFRRDKRFLVRLVLTLTVSGVVATLIGGRLTSEGSAGCAADAIEGTPERRPAGK